MMTTATELARQAGLENAGFRLVMNCLADAGQSVLHLHLHLLGGRPWSGRPDDPDDPPAGVDVARGEYRSAHSARRAPGGRREPAGARGGQLPRRRRSGACPRPRSRLSARPPARAARPAERGDGGVRAGDRRHTRPGALGALPAGGGPGGAGTPGSRRRNLGYASRAGCAEAPRATRGDSALPHRAARRRLPPAARRADHGARPRTGARSPPGARGVPPAQPARG